MSDFPQDVYARNLVSHRGYPLWTPEPHIELPDSYKEEGLKIGDVGVVVPEDGSFDVFFNITLPREHSLHAHDGVPDNFRQVEVGRDDYRITPDAESPGRVMASRGVECRASRINPFDLEGEACSLTDHQFDLCRNEGGMLILPEGAERHRLAKELMLLDDVIENAVGWYQFARERLYRNISSDALYIVTGFHKTNSWSLASFQNTGASSARCKLIQSTIGGPLLTLHSTWETTHPLEWRIGPPSRLRTSRPNQTVFITGFKVAVNEQLLHLKRVTVKAGHTGRTVASRLVGFGAGLANFLVTEPSGEMRYPGAATRRYSTDDQVGAKDTASIVEHGPVTIERLPHVSQPFHPSDLINRSLLRIMPSAKAAVTHDSQWTALLENGVLTQEELVQEERLEAALLREYLVDFRNGVVFLENRIHTDEIRLASDDILRLPKSQSDKLRQPRKAPPPPMILSRPHASLSPPLYGSSTKIPSRHNVAGVQCQVCARTLTSRLSLEMHMQLVHSDFQTLFTTAGSECQVCGKTFVSPGSLEAHMQTSHAGVASGSKRDVKGKMRHKDPGVTGDVDQPSSTGTNKLPVDDT